MTHSRHDVAVVGGGHNGLICAAYLARAGLDVVALETRDEVGGCASTVSALGARVNACNCDHLSIRTTPILEELELSRHGLRYLDVDPGQLSLLWEGGPAWFLFHDVPRTLESLRLSYPGEVESYRRYVEAALPVARLLFELALGVPTRRRRRGGTQRASSCSGWASPEHWTSARRARTGSCMEQAWLRRRPGCQVESLATVTTHEEGLVSS